MHNDKKNKYDKFFRYINKITNIIAGLIALSLFSIVIFQIFGRLIGNSAPWTEEMTRYMFIWMIFLGIAIGLREAESPRVTFFLNRLPSIFKNIGRWIYVIGTISFLMFMAIFGTNLVLTQVASNETSSVLTIPLWIIGISIPISAILGIINTIQSVIYHRDLI